MGGDGGPSAFSIYAPLPPPRTWFRNQRNLPLKIHFIYLDFDASCIGSLHVAATRPQDLPTAARNLLGPNGLFSEDC